MIDLLFVSPHLKKIGETYVLPRLCEYANSKGDKFALFNVAGEWDHLRKSDEYLIIDNKYRWFVNSAPDLERLNPWLNYRVWLFFVSISIFFGLLNAIKTYDIKLTVARMATSAVGLCSKFTKRTKFIASMAGVPHQSLLRSITWPFLYHNFYRVVMPCKSMEDNIIGFTKKPKTQILTCANAVIPESFNPVDFAPDDEQICNLVFVGRLTRQKGVDTLIKAMSNLDDSFMLDIYGDGEDEAALKQLTSDLNIDAKVKFHGRKDDPWQYIKKYNIYVMPSRWEGPGHTIIEALSYGIPSIVSNCPYGPEETVGFGEYAEVFNVDDTKGLAQKIKTIWQSYDLNLRKAKAGQLRTKNYKPSSVHNFWKSLASNDSPLF